MMSQNETLVQIARTSGAGVSDEIQINIVGPDSTNIRVAVTMEQFASMITGSAHVPCRVVRWNIAPNIGVQPQPAPPRKNLLLKRTEGPKS